MPGKQLTNMTINFGPQHPAAHGVLRLVMELSGEVRVGGGEGVYSVRFVDSRLWSGVILILDCCIEVQRNSWNTRHTCRYAVISYWVCCTHGD